MGLDTVELLVAVEKKFDIAIPDKEAENIYTVADFADSVFTKISTKPTEKCLTQILFYKIRTAINQLNDVNKNIKPDSIILDILPNIDLINEWTRLEEMIGLRLPELIRLDFDKNLEKDVKLFGVRLYSRTDPVTEGTIRQLIDWIISTNFEDLLSIGNLSSKYEVERIICGIISDMMGIPINKIEINHSITDDLRIQ
jgi:hypothetical protein